MMNHTKSKVNERWTHFAILIDRSMSMQSLDTSEIAGTCQTIIKDGLKDENGDRIATATVANFDNSFKIVRRNISAKDLEITSKDIEPRGMTTLVPSIARLIHITKNDIDNESIRDDEIPGTVVFILLSDGEQTSGKLSNRLAEDIEYEGMGQSGYDALSKLVKLQEDNYQWKFFFLGANMDVKELGPKLGFNPSTCINYSHNTESGTCALRSTSDAIGRYQKTPASKDRSANFIGYTQDERGSCIDEDKFSIDASGGGLISPDLDNFTSYSHRQWPDSPWEKYTQKQSNLIDKIRNTIDSGCILLPGTPFEIRWGLMATSSMMRDIPSSKIIQVNRDTGFTRIVKKN